MKEQINNICRKVPFFTTLFNARVRHYFIKDHIINVLNQFEKYFSQYFVIIKIEEFKLFLILHDIGKPLAYKQGNRNNQYDATINEIQKYQTELGISDKNLNIYIALICASSFGKYMESKLSLEETFLIILKQSKKSDLPINDFFYLLSVYYQCDVASYTQDAGGIAYLEHLFEYKDGFKVYCKTTNLLKFSNLYAQKYSLLFDKIMSSSKVSNQKIDNYPKNVSTNSIQLNVVGKIDLSKFQKPKKEIKKNKINLYIIDTNVFIDYPDIISKINKEYPVILSAKVIDELDNLKSKLDNEGKRNVQKALKSINGHLDKRDVRMEISDISLLPVDFNKRSPDNQILTVALKFKSENPILLTSDHGLQIKAKGMKITTITLKEFINQLGRI